ncbi:MAG: hypothetical protein Q8R32_01260 [bacterium]|nr:hypothetical protein [bacterium]
MLRPRISRHFTIPLLVGGIIILGTLSAPHTALSAQHGITFLRIGARGPNPSFMMMNSDRSGSLGDEQGLGYVLPEAQALKGAAAIGATVQRQQRPTGVIDEVIIVPENQIKPFLEAATGGPVSVDANSITTPSTRTPGETARIDRGSSREDADKGPSIFGTLGNILLAIIDYLLTFIMWVLGILLSTAGMFTDFMLSVKTLAGAPTVGEMWKITRDSLNFVFILSLLAIAFSTIAGIESYNMRALLPRLITAALLVNFSLAISGAFLQGANVLKNEALRYLPKDQGCKEEQKTGASGGAGTSITCALANSAAIKGQYEFSKSSFLAAFGFPGSTFAPVLPPGSTTRVGAIRTSDFLTNAGAVISAAIAVVFIALFAIALIALAAMLGVRIAVLVLLLVLSPVPYVFSIVPRAEEWAKKWWSTFIQYTIFLPAIVFFLVLAVRIAGKTGNLAREFGAETATLGVTGGPGQNIVLNMFSAFIVSAFIIVSLFVAKALGIYGADAAIRFGRQAVGGGARLAMAPARVAGAGATGLGKGAARVTGLTGLYQGVTGGWQARKQLKEEKITTGRAASAGAWVGTLGGGPAHERYLNQQAAENQKGLERDNVGQKETLGLMANGTKVQKRGAAMHAQKKEYFDKAADYETGLEAVPEGSSVHKDIQKAYDKYNPILARSKGKGEEKLTEADIESYAAGPLFSDKVRHSIDANKEEIQKALNKAGADDVAKWSGDLVGAILGGGRTQTLDLGVDKVNAILRRGRQEAKAEIVDQYNKQTSKTSKLPKKSPGQTPPEAFTGPEIKAIGKIVT